MGAGFADFSLLAFHFDRVRLVDSALVPLFYAVAMAAGGLAALVFGRVYDRVGIGLLVPLTVVAALSAPLGFLGSAPLALLGVVLWGAGPSIHESIMAAAVADMVPAHRTASAYGIFTMAFGLAWFAGSAALGILYDRSVETTVALSIALQLLAVPLLVVVARWRGPVAGR